MANADMREDVKFFEIDDRKFMLEKVFRGKDICGYRLTVKEPTYDMVYPFKGETAYADALAEILSYSEIDRKDFEEVI